MPKGGENHAANNSKQNTRATCSGGNTRSPSGISSPASFKLWIFRGRRKLEEEWNRFLREMRGEAFVDVRADKAEASATPPASGG